MVSTGIRTIGSSSSNEFCGVEDHSSHLTEQFRRMGFSNAGELSVTWPLSPEAVINYMDSLIGNLVTHVIWQYSPYAFDKKGLPGWLPSVMEKFKKAGFIQGVFFHEVAVRPHHVTDFKAALLGKMQKQIARQMNEIADVSFTSIPLYQSYFPDKPPTIVPIGPNILVEDGEFQFKPASGFFCFSNRFNQELAFALADVSHLASSDRLLTIAGQSSKAQETNIKRWLKETGMEENVGYHGPAKMETIWCLLEQVACVLQPEPVINGMGGISAKNGTASAAFAAGRPLITCKGDMTQTDIFRDGENVLFVKENTRQGWQAAITKWLYLPAAEKRRMGEAARRTYEEVFRWEKAAAVIAGELLSIDISPNL